MENGVGWGGILEVSAAEANNSDSSRPGTVCHSSTYDLGQVSSLFCLSVPIYTMRLRERFNLHHLLGFFGSLQKLTEGRLRRLTSHWMPREGKNYLFISMTSPLSVKAGSSPTDPRPEGSHRTKSQACCSAPGLDPVHGSCKTPKFGKEWQGTPNPALKKEQSKKYILIYHYQIIQHIWVL